MNRKERRGHGPPTLPPSYPNEEAWWKWAGVPRFRRRDFKYSRHQKRDTFRGALVASGLILLGLALIFGILWIVRVLWFVQY